MLSYSQALQKEYPESRDICEVGLKEAAGVVVHQLIYG